MSKLVITRGEVENQIKQMESEISGLLSEKDDKSRQVNRLKLELQQMESRLSEKTTGATIRDSGYGATLKETINEKALSLEEVESLKAARLAITTATDNHQKVTAALESKEQQLSALLQEKSKLINAAAIGEILSHQSRMEQAKQTVIIMEEAISKQQEIIAIAERDLSSNHTLKDKRAEILAEIAINGSKYTGKDLEAIDKQIQSESSEVEANRKKATKTITDAKQTISALEAKLTTAKGRQNELETNNSQVIREFLAAEAERAGEDYLRAVNSLEASFRQLIAISKIMVRNGQPAIHSGTAEALFIPAFNLEVVAIKANKNTSSNSLRLINTAANYRDELQKDITDTISRWNKAGVVI